MNKQKQLWEDLAKENSKYYINSDFGRKITDDQFKQSGKEAYEKLIANDGLVWTRESILDFGCGKGRLAEYMTKDFKKVIGIDISSTMITEAKKRLGGVKNVEFMETDGVNIPLPENSFDFVFAYLVFQHIKERDMVEKSFKEIYRVLKPGGVFKVLLRSDKQPDMSKWWSGVEYSQDKSKELYEEIGFKLIKLENVDKNSYWLWLQKYIFVNDLETKRWERGKRSTLYFYRKKLPWKTRQFNKKLFLPKYFKDLIGDKKKVSIAEIGSGMFCTIGSLWKDVEVSMYPSDILAEEFNQILKKRNVTPLIPVEKQNMENLTYQDNFFDIVHCVNALDHTADVLRALKEMYRVVKPEGYIYLRHFFNVAEKQRYHGMHMWNINLNEKGECVIWNKKKRIKLSDYFKNVNSTKKKEMEWEKDDLVVSIIQKL